MKILSIPINTDRKDFEAVVEIRKAYSDIDGFFGTCILTNENHNGNLDDIPFICARAFIQNPKKVPEQQRYIIALQSRGYGKRIIIDMISLNEENHEDIAYDYCQRTEKIHSNNQSSDKFQSTNEVSVGLAGGLMIINDNLRFTGQSHSYGNVIYGVNSNDLACYITQCCELDAVGRTLNGKSYVKDLLQLMINHKGSKEFYEEWIVDQINRTNQQIGNHLLTQQMNGLFNMKIADGNLHDGDKFIKI